MNAPEVVDGKKREFPTGGDPSHWCACGHHELNHANYSEMPHACNQTGCECLDYVPTPEPAGEPLAEVVDGLTELLVGYLQDKRKAITWGSSNGVTWVAIETINLAQIVSSLRTIEQLTDQLKVANKTSSNLADGVVNYKHQLSSAQAEILSERIAFTESLRALTAQKDAEIAALKAGK